MRIDRRKSVRRMMLPLIAFHTFITGVSVFHLYAGAAAFLFQPKQPANETTQSLTPQSAVPTPPTTQSQPPQAARPVSAGIVFRIKIKESSRA